MSHLPIRTEQGQASASNMAHAQELLEQSAAARDRGDHWKAQQLASAAHKWVRDEAVRLRRLGQAQEEWTRTTQQLEQAWDRDRSCATLDELSARHPELKRAIASCEAAAERVRALGGTLLQPHSTDT